MINEDIVLAAIEKAIYEDGLSSEQIIEKLEISEALFIKLFRKIKTEKKDFLAEIDEELKDFYKPRKKNIQKTDVEKDTTINKKKTKKQDRHIKKPSTNKQLKTKIEKAFLISARCPVTKRNRTFLIQQFIDLESKSVIEIVAFDGIYETRTQLHETFDEYCDNLKKYISQEEKNFDFISFYEDDLEKFSGVLKWIEERKVRGLTSTARSKE